MKNDRVIPGVILIALGAIFLMHSFGYLHIHWANIWRLWPIFIVIAGVNLIFANNKSGWATAIKLVVIIGGIGILLFGNFGNRHGFWPRNFYYEKSDDGDGITLHTDDDDDDDDDDRKIVRVEGNSTFNEPFHADARLAKLNINGGAGEYILADTTNQMFQAFTKERNGGYEYSHTVQDSVYLLNFDMQNKRFRWKGRNGNTVKFKLNTTPVWDLDLNFGATKLDFDLSPYKVRNLDLNGGAGDFELKLGQPLLKTNVSVSTGVSEVTINIPKNAACHIETDSGLSSNRFDGFTKTSDNNYETPGFAAAKNKFYIDISGGLSGFRVNRY